MQKGYKMNFLCKVKLFRLCEGGCKLANVFQQNYCPICGETIDPNYEWILTVNECFEPQLLFHKKCYDQHLNDDMGILGVDVAKPNTDIKKGSHEKL